MIRPKLEIGDVVKLSKKGKTYNREFPMRSTLVVSEVDGDGVEKSTIVTCRTKVKGEFKFYKFFRSELWSVGKNVFKV